MNDPGQKSWTWLGILIWAYIQRPHLIHQFHGSDSFFAAKSSRVMPVRILTKELYKSISLPTLAAHRHLLSHLYRLIDLAKAEIFPHEYQSLAAKSDVMLALACTFSSFTLN